MGGRGAALAPCGVLMVVFDMAGAEVHRVLLLSRVAAPVLLHL